jgi:hypothetical protein
MFFSADLTLEISMGRSVTVGDELDGSYRIRYVEKRKAEREISD